MNLAGFIEGHKRVCAWLVVAIILGITIIRYWVTLSTEFADGHDPQHVPILILKIVIYLIGCFFLFTYYATKFKPQRWDLIMFLLLIILFASIFILAYTDIYKNLGIYSSNQEGREVITKRAVDCFYFSIVTWTTLGYGDFRPTEAGRIYAASEALLGYFFMAISIGFVIHIFLSLGQQLTERSIGTRT
jgi:hypothetical protein